MARIIFEYDNYDKNGSPIICRSTRQLDLTALSEDLNSSPESLFDSLLSIEGMKFEEFKKHCDSCQSFRSDNPLEYKKMLDFSMSVSVFNDRKKPADNRIPILTSDDLKRALRQLIRENRGK